MPPKLPPGAVLVPDQTPKEHSGLKLPPGAVLEEGGPVHGPKLPPGAVAAPSVDRFLKGPKPAVVPNPGIDEVWKTLGEDEKEQIFNGLSASEQVNLMDQLKMFGHATAFSAPPQFSAETMKNVLWGQPWKDPWIRQKVSDLVYTTSKWLPAAGGMAGGVAGGELGTSAGPGGTVAGAVAGSGLGGAVGEAAKQGIAHGMGWDKYDEPQTTEDRLRTISKSAAQQMFAELLGQGIARGIRPTTAKAINKLYYAGRFNVGDLRMGGALESVFQDIGRVEKTLPQGATTVGDLVGVLNTTKREIGQQVDMAYAQPIMQNNRRVMLGQAQANTVPLQARIRTLLTKNPSIVREAQINPTGKAAAYLKLIQNEADKYAKGNWTYSELADKRILLNNELAPLYTLPPGEQRVYLNDHPELQIAKEEAEAIRDITYPEMDYASGHPVGTTARLQEKRGIIMGLTTQAQEHLQKLKSVSRQSKGAPLSQKVNISTYGSSSGKPGFSIHRLHSWIHRPTEEQMADSRVASAFGRSKGAKVAKTLSAKPGMEIMSMPIRAFWEAIAPGEPPPPEASAETPTREQLASEAKQRQPGVANPATHYSMTATGPQGHKIGSNDGTQWFDLQTGQRVQ